MNNDYEDIRSRIAEPPKWFDEYAVPRYCEFHPRKVANVYAQEVVLLLIKCQACKCEFRVVMSDGILGPQDLAKRFAAREIHYGDPPNMGCCAAGPTMNSEPHFVLQFWMKTDHNLWGRAHFLEGDIRPSWVTDP